MPFTISEPSVVVRMVMLVQSMLSPPQNGAAQTEAPPGIEDLYWYASPDGALVCFDGTENLIALPLGDARIPGGGGGWRKRIEGRDYIVYRTKDGRLLR